MDYIDLPKNLYGNDLALDIPTKKFQLIEREETEIENTSERPLFIGNECNALHHSEEYVVRRPIKYGDLNVLENYSAHDCIEDL